MKIEHKIIRENLKNMPKPEAEKILFSNLPDREFKAIYLNDVEQLSQFQVGELLGCTDSNIKKIKRSGYKKLTALFFNKTK